MMVGIWWWCWVAGLRVHGAGEGAASEVAGVGCGGGGGEEAVRPGEEEPEPAEEGPGAAREGGEGAVEEGQAGGEDGGAPRVWAGFTVRRVVIDPEERRVLYLARLEGLMWELDGIIADPVGFERIQLDAMKVLIRAVRMCYSIVRDVDVEMLEDELEGIKEENRRAEEARGELGYEIEG